MANADNKNATIEYTKFVQSSRHSEMKAIFDTFMPFILFKECLDKKEKDELQKILEEKKKKEEIEDDKINLNDIQKGVLMQNSNSNSIKKDSSNKQESDDSDEESKKSEDPFDLTKDYDKVFNFNLITDDEKDEFRKGKPFPYLKNNLQKLISKKFLGLIPPPLPMQEQYHFQLMSFKFYDVTNMRCPKICFQQNIPLFAKIPDPHSIRNPISDNMDENSSNSQNVMKSSTIIFPQKNSLKKKKKIMKYKSLQSGKSEIDDDKSHSSSSEDENKVNSSIERSSLNRNSMFESLKSKEKQKDSELMYRNTTNLKYFNARSSLQSEVQLKSHFLFKTENGKSNQFIKFNKNFINNDAAKRTLSAYSIDEHFPEFGQKIAIPSDTLRKELFIFDPIIIDLNNGALSSFIFEEILKKRAKLLFPYRQNFIKIIIIKLLQFLFIIKSKIANKKNMKNANQLTNNKKKNGKTKLKEIAGSNIITFSDVKPFMKSKFGHFNMEVFKNAYEKKITKK